MFTMLKFFFTKTLVLIFLVDFLSACTNLNYDKNNGSYSKNYTSSGDLSKNQKKSMYKRLLSANNFHGSKQYNQSYEIYESILADQENLLANIYALWGIIALNIDRNNPKYDRGMAIVSLDVMERRIKGSNQFKLIYEAKLLKYSAELMIKADLSKDNVIEENKVLIAEITQRDEAIKRLRDLSLGQ